MNIQSLGDLFKLNKWVEAPGSMSVDPLSYRGVPLPGQFFKYKDAKSSLIAFNKCPPVNAIANMQAGAFTTGKTWVMNTQGRPATGEYANGLNKLFTRPNPLQSWKTLEAALVIDYLIFGYAVMIPRKPNGFTENIDTYQLWRIPPTYIEFEESEALYYETGGKIINRVFITYKGKRTEIKNINDIVIIRDTTPNFSSMWVPESRTRALEYPINNVIGAYQSRNVLIANRGPLYVVSSGKLDADGPKSLTTKEADDIKKQFKDNYGLMDNQSTAIITAATAKVDTIGFDMKQLGLHEETRESAIAIANGYNHPPFLLGLTDSTFNNQNEAKKGLYEGQIIPMAETFYEQLAQWFDVSKYNIVIEKDYKHLAILQEDAQKSADARYKRNQAFLIEFQNNLMTLDRWRELNNEDTMPDIEVDGTLMKIGGMYYFQLLKLGLTFGTAKPIQEHANTAGENESNGTGGSKAKS